MKIVIPGGSGQVGGVLARAFRKDGHEVVLVSRSGRAHGEPCETWDGATLSGSWPEQLDGADAVINLAGRSVNCRYVGENLRQMMASRVDSTRVVGEAIARASQPPPVWLQMSTATIYAHRFDAPNDEASGIIGGSEPDVPAYWSYSVEIAKRWEQTQRDADTPSTRKVALRSAMVMSPDVDGIFDVMLRLVRKGLGGSVAGGRQYVSWIHDSDFVAAVKLFGDLEIERRTYQRAGRGRVGVPVDLRLGIVERRYTPRVRRLIAHATAVMTAEDAASFLEQAGVATVSSSTLVDFFHVAGYLADAAKATTSLWAVSTTGVCPVSRS